MVNLVGAKYFAQLSGAMTQIIFARLFQLQIACALLAWLHLLGEWLYLGRQPRRWLVALLTGLFTLSLMGSLWLGPRLRGLHRTRVRAQCPIGRSRPGRVEVFAGGMAFFKRSTW